MCYPRAKIAGSILVIILFCSGISPLYGQQKIGAAVEYTIKSANIYKICKFTEWPGMFDTTRPFVISVIGEIEDGKEIVIPEDKLIGNRKIDIRKINSIDEIKDSEALFIYSSVLDSLDLIIEYVKDKPILTFSDTEGFAERGVIFNFYIEDDFIKFEINRRYAQQSHVKLNSQLFALGRIISK